jgi:hypothetical protein
VSNCSQQIWHRPQDDESAATLSRIFGEVCEVVWNASSGTNEGRSQGAGAAVPGHYSSGATAGASLGTRYRPALNVAEVMSLGDFEVLVQLLGKRSRLYSSYAVLQNALAQLPGPPRPPKPAEIRAAAAETPAPATAAVQPVRPPAGPPNPW